MTRFAINVDFVEVRVDGPGDDILLPWGEQITVLSEAADHLRVSVPEWGAAFDGSISVTQVQGSIPRSIRVDGEVVPVVVPVDESAVLRVSFVDVQQGDATLIQTAGGKTITLDGGENQLFARFLASRFRGTTASTRVPIDAMIVTHGDADHFVGLVRLHEAEEEDEKQIFVRPRRVFHNGLVKATGSDPKKIFGEVVADGDDLYVVDLEDDLTKVPLERLNSPFVRWRKALTAWESEAGNIVFRRLASGDSSAFSFLDGEGIAVEVLGPIPRKVGSRHRWGLQLLPQPRDGMPMAHLDFDPGALSASHTINGHSIVLRLTYGNVRMLFAGDLNNAAEQTLVKAHEDGDVDLASEVFKVPHHGSHEFEPDFLKAVSPVVSVVSSGDERTDKEYIHPRATLMSALGRYARDDRALVFVTELVAFFQQVGYSVPSQPMPPRAGSSFYGFKRAAFGCVRVRTDGQRLFVFTDSGRRDYKEAYAYRVAADHTVQPVAVVKARLPR